MFMPEEQNRHNSLPFTVKTSRKRDGKPSYFMLVVTTYLAQNIETKTMVSKELRGYINQFLKKKTF